MKYNGNITLNTQGQSEVQNLIVERISATPAFYASEAGRIVYNTTDRLYYMNTGLVWVSLSTGANSTALQTELDNVETTLGPAVTGAGAFNPAAFIGSNIVSPSSITDAINKLDAAITGKNELSELLDVAIGGATNAQYLIYNGTKWVNHTLVMADVTDVTSTATEVNQLHGTGVTVADLTKLHAVSSTAVELNKLTGATLSTIELNYVTGVTSPLQTQLDNKQPLDAQLTSIAAHTPTSHDVLVGKADGTYELLQGAGLRSTQGLVIGVDIQAWDADLDQIAAFTPTAPSTETIGAVSHTGLTDFMVATGALTEGNRWSIQRGAQARTSLGLGDIAIHDDAEYMRVDGTHTMIADINMNGFQIGGLSVPLVAANAATKGYVDSLVAGLTWKNAAIVATVGNIVLSGVQTVDGVVLTAGDRVLVKAQTDNKTNGVYVVAAGVWARSSDMDVASEFDGAGLWIESGTVYGNTGWVCTAHQPIVVGTTPITFVQFNGATGITAGTGLVKSGNTLSVLLGAGIAELPTAEVGLDLYDNASSAIILTLDGSARSTDSNSRLHLLLDAGSTGKLVQSANGLKVTANTISELELTASVAGNGLSGGNGAPIAVVSAPGTAGTVGTLVITANGAGVTLGTTSTSAARGDHIHAANVVTFDNTVSAIIGNPANVQAAIEGNSAKIAATAGTLAALTAEVDRVETAAGLNADGTYTPNAASTYVSAARSLKDADSKLDVALSTLRTKVTQGYFVYSGNAAQTHTVVHNIGSQYCNVTVIDSGTDEQIIPQSVVFDSTGQLTVTFNVALACKVVVMGLAV
jgi:hypothetical protein